MADSTSKDKEDELAGTEQPFVQHLVELRDRLTQASGKDASWMTLGVITDQRADIADEVRKVHAHPLISDSVLVGGFLYDVDSGLLEQVV